MTMRRRRGTVPRHRLRLIVRPSSIHSVGVFTRSPIRRGAWVIEYTGPRLTKKEADRRYLDSPKTYLFGLDNGRIIDGIGKAAYVNHSCQPNCETDEIKGRVWIIALRNIRPGEELTYDYNLYDGEDEAPCHCGSRRCRGTLYAPGEEPGAKKKQELETRQKQAEKKRKSRAAARKRRTRRTLTTAQSAEAGTQRRAA